MQRKARRDAELDNAERVEVAREKNLVVDNSKRDTVKYSVRTGLMSIGRGKRVGDTLKGASRMKRCCVRFYPA